MSDSSELRSDFFMDLRKRLVNAIYGGQREIGDARWMILREHLRYEIESFDEDLWDEFLGLAREKLAELDLFESFLDAERSGEPLPTSAVLRESALGNQPGPSAEELARLNVRAEDLITPSGIRSRARAETLRLYDEISSDGRIPYSREPLSVAVIPRGGQDGTVPRWLALFAVELQTPAEELLASYKSLQEQFTGETRPKKTEERTYEVVRFVLHVRRHTLSYSWEQLCKTWNASRERDEDRFLGAAATQTFRRYYERGIKATLPRQEKSRKSLEATLKKTRPAHLFDTWAKAFRRTF